MPMRVPFSNVSSTITTLSFNDVGTVMYFSNTFGRSYSYTISPPFIVPSVIPIPQAGDVTIMAAHSISGGVVSTTSNIFYFITPDIGYDATSNTLFMNSKGGTLASVSPTVLNNNPYNKGGMYGITVKRDTSVLLTLSGLDTTKGLWLLSSLTFKGKFSSGQQSLLSSNISNMRNFTNIYPLFPGNMKPTDGNGIVVDRENGQWLYVNALINNKWTICKFQLRAT
jgi:hypothetical protein